MPAAREDFNSQLPQHLSHSQRNYFISTRCILCAHRMSSWVPLRAVESLHLKSDSYTQRVYLFDGTVSVVVCVFFRCCFWQFCFVTSNHAANPPSHPFSCDGKHSNKSSFGWFPLLVPAGDSGWLLYAMTTTNDPLPPSF